MKIKFVIPILLLNIIFASCTEEYECADLQIQPAFINYLPADIDTFILLKFKASDNYQNLIDTFVVRHGYNGLYKTSSDTTSVLISDEKNGIKAGFDWKLFIPAKNKTILVSDINSEKKSGKRGHGIFSMDPVSGCTNTIFSAKVNNQSVTFSNPGTAGYQIFIRN